MTPTADHVHRSAPRRAATISDVAAMAEVSTATVSRVLNSNYPVAASTRERVLRAVTKLGYAANANARALAQSDSKTIGIIVPELVDPFFGYMVRGLEQAAQASGRLAIIATTGTRRDHELTLIDRMRERRVDAVILVSGTRTDIAYQRQLVQRAEALEAMGSRLVLCAHPPLTIPSPARSVAYDNEGGAFAVTEHLISNGHRRIAFVGGEAERPTIALRREGYLRALRSRGIEVDEALIRSEGFGRDPGYTTTRALLDEDLGITAIFAVNDTIAAGVYDALGDAGVRIPSDMSVVAYDDTPLATSLSPKLTTVHVPLEQMGREALNAAVAEHDAFARTPEDALTLGTYLVHRESVAPRKP
ncbi:LacI family DNA-binding transcriptional regulator [Microbacterium hydrocarbonoxydans]|uniref:LacI family DNA-binding transcriptional regulator n=1 Tax=Microbacterium hydrocarbonoxydans TaxID=273678 RepID=UPI001FB8A129|nr:LacI family DNA-binding transcriptional regulator [Microbacterium hydrocarbonoxydans]